MPSTVVLTQVIKSGEKVFVRWEGGDETEFASLAALTEDVREADNDIDLTRRMALSWILARQPTLDNIAPIQNKDFSFDLSSPNPIKVQ